MRPGLVDGVLLILTLASVVLLACFYVSRERFFYYWDYAVYQDIAEAATDTFLRLSPLDSFYTLYRSTADAYSSLFTVPLVPILLLFGESRLVYVAGLAATYLVPFALALGALAERLIPGRPRRVFWATAAVALLTPMTWVPTLRGFPDAGAATLIALALRLHLEEGQAGRTAGSALFAGALLGLAVLLRRHFVFGVAAFFTALLVCACLRLASDAWRKRPGSGRRLRNDLVWIVAAAAGCSLALIVVGHYFLLRILTREFASYYRAYEMPLRDTLAWFVKPYGLPVCFLSALGFVAGLRARILDPAAARLVLVFGALSFAQWVGVARQIGEQYTLHFTPTVVLGLTCLLWTILLRFETRTQRLASGGVAVFLCANLLFGLSGLRVAYEPGPLRSSVFAANWPPLKSRAYDDVRRLVEFLHGQVPAQSPLFLAASSHVINPSLLAHAERALYGRTNARMDVLDAPAIDARDSYPLEMLLRSDWVVVVRPFQHHLDPADQQVVGVVLDLFEAGQGLARDFAPVSEPVPLGVEASATIYRRLRLTTLEGAVTSLSFMEDHLDHRPGAQPAWVALSHLTPPLIREQGSDSWTLLTSPKEKDDDPGNAWLYLRRMASGVRATGRTLFVERRCPGITLVFWGVGADGRRTKLAIVPREPKDGSTFDLRLETGGESRIVVEAADSRPDPKACLAWIVDLRINGGD